MERLKRTLTTREGFQSFIQVEQTEGMKQNKGSRLWTNKDLQPNPPETRHWNAWAFFLFQVSEFGLNTSLPWANFSTWPTVQYFFLSNNI